MQWKPVPACVPPTYITWQLNIKSKARKCAIRRKFLLIVAAAQVHRDRQKDRIMDTTAPNWKHKTSDAYRAGTDIKTSRSWAVTLSWPKYRVGQYVSVCKITSLCVDRLWCQTPWLTDTHTDAELLPAEPKLTHSPISSFISALYYSIENSIEIACTGRVKFSYGNSVLTAMLLVCIALLPNLIF